MASTKKKTTNTVKLLSIILVFLIGVGYFSYRAYKHYWAPNVTENAAYLYIPTGSTFEDLMQNLQEQHVLIDTASFHWVAKKKDYINAVKSGKYALEAGMNNSDLVKKLRGGLQEPVKFQFQNIRLKEEFAAFVAKQLEPDSASIMNLMNNDSLAGSYGFEREDFYSMFIPNTYELWWNTSAEKFFERMHTEHSKFWTQERLDKAEARGLTPNEVSILASIVKGEAMHNDEMPRIAGLYLNRLKKGILLQADPTVIFAAQDFTIRRVLNKHLIIPSPYNTYIHKGLPPGPITLPSIVAIDAVLNAQTHDYIYMCAKDDFSGYHNFATTMAEHLVNARKFQQALNERNIKK